MNTINSEKPAFEVIDNRKYIFPIKTAIVTSGLSVEIGCAYHLLAKNMDKFVLEHALVVLKDVLTESTNVTLIFQDSHGEEITITFDAASNVASEWFVLDDNNFEEFKRLRK